jgi:hypothetical protein
MMAILFEDLGIYQITYFVKCVCLRIISHARSEPARFTFGIIAMYRTPIPTYPRGSIATPPPGKVPVFIFYVPDSNKRP